MGKRTLILVKQIRPSAKAPAAWQFTTIRRASSRVSTISNCTCLRYCTCRMQFHIAAARKKTLDIVKLAHANAPFEPAADHCDFAYFGSAALCAASAAERCQVESGRSKRGRHHRRRQG